MNEDCKWIVNTSAEEGRAHIKRMLDGPITKATLETLQQAEIYELSHQNRSSLVEAIIRGVTKASKALKSKPESYLTKRARELRAGSPNSSMKKDLAGYDAAARKQYLSDPADAAPVEILAPEALITGNPSTVLSPLEASALSAVETAWSDASRLAGMVKNYARAGTAAKALCGLRLRALREHYFGPVSSKGGRPKKSEAGTSWEILLADRLGITAQTGSNWMHMADAVEQLADSQGLDLRTTCEKLPWDWSAEESALIDATVHKLTEDKTQRQLLQADFLSDLGYAAPEKTNSSNNPLGKNGGKKKPASSPAALLKERQEAARLLFLGTDKPGRVEKGSVALFMETFITNQGADLEALPQAELRDLYEHTVKPFAAAFRKLAGL